MTPTDARISHRLWLLGTLLALVGGGCASTAPHSSTVAPAPAPAPVRPPILTAPPPERVTPDAPFRQDRPAAAAETPFQIPAVQRFQLANGMKVLLVESHKLPLVSADLIVRTGSGGNPPGKAGLAELVSNMIDEGTKTRTAPQIADEIDQLGARLITSASWDASLVSVSSLTEQFDRALQVWGDVLRNPTFPAAELDRVRDNLVASLARRKDSPPAIAGLVFARALYGENQPYGWPGTGTESSVKALTVDDLKRFYAANYRPNNAFLVVSGDITEAQIHAKFEPLLKGWASKPVPPIKPTRSLAPGKTTIYLVDKADAPQSSIRVGLLGVARKTPDFYKLLVMNEILGGGFRRLDLDLREKKGWTYGARSQFDFRRAAGPWLAGGEFVAEHTADAVAALIGHVAALRDQDVSDEELREAKAGLEKAFPARFATPSQTAWQLATLELYDLPKDELETFTAKIEAVTKDDVRRVAKQRLDPDRLVIVVVGDKRSQEAELKKLAPVELRDLDGLPLAP